MNPVILRVGDQEIRVEAATLAARLWESAPAFLTDPDSPQREAGKLQSLALKGLIRQFLPGVMKQLWGDTAPPMPAGRDAEDLLRFATRIMISIITSGASSQPWRLTLENDYADQGTVTIWHARGIIADARQDTAPEEAGPGGTGETDPAQADESRAHAEHGRIS